MAKIKKERRKPIFCPNCGHPMVCMNKFASVYANLSKGFYIWYVCPRRIGEKGCGQSILFEISPKTKRPQRVVCSVRVKKLCKK